MRCNRVVTCVPVAAKAESNVLEGEPIDDLSQRGLCHFCSQDVGQCHGEGFLMDFVQDVVNTALVNMFRWRDGGVSGICLHAVLCAPGVAQNISEKDV